MKSQRMSSKKLIPKSSEDETLLHSIYLNEFNDYFPQILSLPAGEFLSNLTKLVDYVTMKKFNVFSEQLKSKVEQSFTTTIFPSEYKIAFTAMKAIKKKHNAGGDLPNFKGNFVKHCKGNSKALHSCGNNLFQFTYNKIIDGNTTRETLLVCPTCDEVYKSNFVKFHCEKCKVDFYSKIIMENSTEERYQLATWEKYHCNITINDSMKCFKCKNPFYLDTNLPASRKMLTCLHCNYTIEQKEILWKCMLCQEEFNADAKVYNPLEYKNMKISVKEAIMNKEKAKPEKVPCCPTIDIKSTKFTHNTKCKGELYLGTMNQKKIVVCGKCESFNDYSNYPWTCPTCDKRFMTNSLIEKKREDNILFSSAKGKPKRLTRYDSGIKPNCLSKSITRNLVNEDDHINPEFLITSPCVSTPFDLVKDKKRMSSLKKNHQNLFSLSGMKSPGNHHDKNIQHLYKSPMLPVKINLAKKFYAIKAQNFEEDISSSIAEDIIRENQLTNKCRKNSNEKNNNNNESSSNLFSTASSNQQSENSNQNTLINDYLAKPNSLHDSLFKDSNSTSNIAKLVYPSFDVNDYKIIKQIGAGSFGKIYMAESPQKKLFAMKKIVGASMEELENLKIEYEILLSLKRKNTNLNLVQIHGIQTKQLDQTTYVMYVLMELADKDWEQDLSSRSKAKSYYNEKEFVMILSSLIKTFAHLQRHNISHRDIKPQNILMFGSEFKLADFGEAKILQSNMPNTDRQTLRGTELYMSPILFKALRNRVSDLKYVEHNTYKSDVFSFGLCALYAATLTFNSLYTIREVYDMQRIRSSLACYLSSRYSPKMVDIMIKMLDVNEKSRCDFIELEKALDNYYI